MHGTPSQRHREGQHSENRKSVLRTPKPHWVWDASCRGTAWSCEEPASSPLDGPLHRRPRENASGQEAQPGPGLPSHISLQVRSHSCRPCSCSQNEKNPENPAPCSQLEWPDDDRAPSFALMGWSAPSEHLCAPSKGVVGSEAHAGCGAQPATRAPVPPVSNVLSPNRDGKQKECAVPSFLLSQSVAPSSTPVTSARPQGRGGACGFPRLVIQP